MSAEDGAGHQADFRAGADLRWASSSSKRRRRHAVDAGRLGERRRPMAAELLAHFGRQTGQGVEVEAGGDAQGLVLAQGGDVELLAVDIGGVARVDGDLRGDGRGDVADLRPDAGEAGNVDAGEREQVEGRAAAAVAVDLQAMAPGLASASGRAPRSVVASFRESGGLGFIGNSSCSANTADLQAFAASGAGRRCRRAGAAGTRRAR